MYRPLNKRTLRSLNWIRKPREHYYNTSPDSKFDRATGQIFTEKTFSIQSGDDISWEYRSHKLVARENVANKFERELGEEKCYGTRSLQFTAIEIVISNVSNLTLHLLEMLPLPTAELLWKTLTKRMTLSFHVWSIFSACLIRGNSSVTEELLRYRQTISSPKSLLDTYTRSLTSTSFDFVTSLTITKPFPIPCLIQLSKVVNLVVLEIIHYGDPLQSLVSDLLVRAWSLSASQEGAFQILRILKLWNHREVTPKSLIFISSLPALAVFDVQDCGFDGYNMGTDFGWNYERMEEPQKKFETRKIPCENFSWDKKIHQLSEKIGFARDNVDFKRAGITMRDPILCAGKVISRLPMACLRLGSGVTSLVLGQPRWFSRIKLPDCQVSKLTDLNSFNTNRANRVIKPTSKRRQRTHLRKNVKKLDDLLQEFT